MSLYLYPDTESPTFKLLNQLWELQRRVLRTTTVVSPFLLFSLAESESTRSFLIPGLVSKKEYWPDTFWPGSKTPLKKKETELGMLTFSSS